MYMIYIYTVWPMAHVVSAITGQQVVSHLLHMRARARETLERDLGYFFDLTATWVELLVEKDFGSASSPTDSYTFEYA